ncbi:MAG TPA: HEAT repeat domain-containing protein, partial [Enhygromyxa sp.]|nr:HEAT repeat domain-containing protein [Enhygromyxa sp.]
FILQAHRRGVFIHDGEIPALLGAFDMNPEWTGDQLVRVAFIARNAMLTELARLAADDRRWIRRAAILAASVDTDAHLLIATQLRATADLRIAAALIDAAGRSPEFADEDALLAWLPQLPEPVITALYAKASARSIAPLRELAVDPLCPSSLRAAALKTLWALSDDRRGLLRELGQRLGPGEAGLFDSTRLSARDGTAAQLLVELGWTDDVEPLAALKLLCEAGKPELLPEITRLFRLVFHEYVGAALAGDFTIKRIKMPELEQLIYRYGRHLIADGRRVRRWIEDRPATGDALVLALVIDWLREDPPAPICVALLETLARKQPTGASLRKIQRYWRHGEVEIKRAALEAILSGESDEHGLTLSIGRLAAAEDPRIVRQALIGIRQLRAAWAEPLVIAALARPEMLIKREAASTLAVIGSRRCVPTLIDWLATHDNPGFRADLRDALQAVAGQGALALLVDALADDHDRRARELLREAIGGLLTVRAAIRLARSSQPAHVELIDAALAGRLALADGDASQLAAALHRIRARADLEPRVDVGERLRLDGFSSAAALALLEHRSPENDRDIFAAVRQGFAEWLRWLSSDPPPEPSRGAALELLLEVCGAGQRDHVAALFEQLEHSVTIVRPKIAIEFIERCVAESTTPVALHPRDGMVLPMAAKRPAVAAGMPENQHRAIALLRALPSAPDVGGLRRYQLLGRLGAVRDRADLERCLADCRLGPDLARESRTLLIEALAIPSERADEAERLDADTLAELERLRDGARDWYRMNEREAERWLSEQLRARPLELSASEPWPWPLYVDRHREQVPRSRADLDALLGVLEGNDSKARDRAARERAAERILAWPAVQPIADSWARVLAVYLADQIDLTDAAIARLAASLDQWPAGSWARTRPLFEALSVQQRRGFLPGWLTAWDRAEPEAELILRAVDQELLIPIVRARAERGDDVLVRLLRPSRSAAMRELVELVAARAPDEVAHLLVTEAAPSERAEIVDPIEGQRAEQLVALLGERDVEVGLAVRAIHRLAELGDEAGDALVSFTRDRRPRVRSAAFRALRGVVSHERRLAAAVGMLEIETRRDVIASLLATIGHGRHEPGFARVLEYLSDRDSKLRDAAERALLAWGAEAEPLLRRAARKARPDRRRRYQELLARIAADEPG